MIYRIINLTLCFFILTGCLRHANDHALNAVTQRDSIFPTGDRTAADFFVGKAYLYPLVARDSNNEYSMGSVTFEAGARTNWHVHPKGQVLLVTEGIGLYQERGKQQRIIERGDVVTIPANVEHWHGATAGTSMVHIAITNYKNEKNVIWGEPVSEDTYRQANQP